MPDSLGPFVTLEPLAPAHAAALFAAIQESASDLAPWLPDLGPGVDLAGVQRWAAEAARAEGHAYHFVMVDRRDGTVLGACGLTSFHPRHRLANLYYWVRSRCTGRGAATAAMRQLARWGLDNLPLQRIEVVVAVGNAASHRAAEKAGATREGRLRRRLVHPDGPQDAVMYSFVRDDFAAG